MATYVELYDLRTNLTPANAAFRNKIAVACTKKAQVLLDLASPTADQLAWVSAVFNDPSSMAQKLFSYVLAANSAFTIAQILAASDTAIQTNVDAAADKLIAGGIV